MDYAKYNEEAAFQKINAGRMLTCLVLAKTVESNILPFDPFEAQVFFNRHFNDTKEAVFKRYCEYHQQDPDELLEYYKTTSKIYKRSIPDQQYTKRKGTVDALVSTFFHFMK